MRLRTNALTTNQTTTKRLIVGFAALATTAIVGAVTMAGATPDGKPTKEECAAAGFSNYGQCVKEWAHNKPGSGYGGGNGNINTINTEVNVDVSGNDNVIEIMLNYVNG